MVAKMKIVIFSILLSLGLWAESIALFGTVVNVAENDILTIRSTPNYKSKKVGFLPPEAYIAIEKCHATWCTVYQIPQQFYENFHAGWVNARYLKFSNRGYVNIEGQKNDCYYAVACKDDKCSVVKSFEYDYEKDILSNLVVEQIQRDKLEPTSNFGAMGEEGDGYCTSAVYIEDHLKKQESTEANK